MVNCKLKEKTPCSY